MPLDERTFGRSAEPIESPSAIEKIADLKTQVQEKASDLAHTAADSIDQKLEGAAVRLEKAASALNEKADHLPGVEKVSAMAHTAADKLSAGADYVRTHNANRMMAGIEAVVKNNPGLALVASAVLGFLVARAFSRSD
jgi:hypothetical protein